MIDWFEAIDKNDNHSFINFDVCDFYPSITESLLDNALSFASRHTTISDKEIEIIKHTKKTLLFHNKTPWTKKNSTFDVTMGSYDGAETCELVGLFLLSKVEHLHINCGLYRDDGLALCNQTPRQIEQTKKEICRIFKSFGLNLSITANKKCVDFLDITLNLKCNTYEPFMKENNTPLYVDKNSNHPPSIIKNLPKSINNRISMNSKNEAIFNKASPPYEDALRKSGHHFKMKFDKGTEPPTVNECGATQPTPTNTPTKRKRKRNITWFNPPYSANVATNVGKEFLTLIDKCFPKSSKLHKLINRNNVKLSYSCMQNVQQIITSHNKAVLNKTNTNTPQQSKTCNCRGKEPCPLDGHCLDECVVYKATVTQNQTNKQETYVGLTVNAFKTRYTQHKSSFKLAHKRTSTTLSEYVWSLKDKAIDHKVTWEILKKLKPLTPGSRVCQLCLHEKYAILKDEPTLNKKSELFSACLHKKRNFIAGSDKRQHNNNNSTRSVRREMETSRNSESRAKEKNV